MKTRIIFIFVLFLSLWTALILRAAYLQVIPNERLQSLNERLYNKTVTVQSRRGAILDRNGVELAGSTTAYSLYADPKIIENRISVAKKVAPILKESYHRISKRIYLYRNKRFVWLKRKITPIQYEKIKELKIRGLGFVEESKRIYPNESTLSQVLGFTGTDGKGLEGLELSLNSELSGKEKKVLLQRDAFGRPLLLNGGLEITHPDGSNVHLTIDSEIQHYLETELARSIAKFQADGAVGIVVDTKTSEILAMANAPTYDLNKPLKVNSQLRRNRVLTDAFEPGSTLKPFVVAAALKHNVIEPNTMIACEGGQFEVGGRIIKEADAKHKFDNLSVSEILAFSSNVGTSKIALMLGSQKYSEFLRQIGFGQSTGLSFPGESNGIVRKLPWRPIELSTISFGHGISATPLQVAMAYTAIANGGVLTEPILVKRIENPDTHNIKEFKSKNKQRVLSEEQANTLRLMLSAVTMPGGTGVNARIPGYPVAGKTGTAQKVDFENGGYVKGAYISSFAGFVPANDPRFVIYVAVDNPKKYFYGSQVAAPIFSKVASYAVRKAGLSPTIISEDNLLHLSKNKKDSTSIKRTKNNLREMLTDQMPSLSGMSLRQALRELKTTDKRVVIHGRGQVFKTEPESGESLSQSQKIHVFLE
ncbi:MAG: PASTA domain-containing protein [Bdellovibrionales bacterium]|nr:PASTA domain-containing protein [Bdellovibrionales bacterium]